MDYLRKAVNSFAELDIMEINSDIYSYQMILTNIHRLCAQVLRYEMNGFSRDQIIEILDPARNIIRRAPFVSRLYDWPNGYQGDYETIEYLFRGKNMAPVNTVAYYCEEYALHSNIAQQHRNKINYHSHLVLDTIINNQNRKEIPKVLLISCGSAKGIQMIQNSLKNFKFKLILNDTDQNALDFAKEKLTVINDRCEYVNGYIGVTMKEVEEHGPYDLIISGGLFDYLKDKHIRKIIKKLYFGPLNKEGIFYFTNIATGNPYRPWLEYLANWLIIERSDEDIYNMLTKIDIDKKNIEIFKEDTHLTTLVKVHKN